MNGCLHAGRVLGVLAVLTLTACQNPFARTGPKFDARQATAAAMTNLTSSDWLRETNRPPSQTGVDEPLPAEPFTLGPGDRIEVEILSDPASRSLLSVGPDGRIYYYLLPGLDVWGLTLAQTRALLEQ